MDYKKPRQSGKQPESTLVGKIARDMRQRGWFVKKIHGNRYQSGLPDLYCAHALHGSVWIEVKMPNRRRQKFGGLSERQVAEFNKMRKHLVPIWVIYSVDDLKELYKNPEKCNLSRILFGHKGDRPRGLQ